MKYLFIPVFIVCNFLAASSSFAEGESADCIPQKMPLNAQEKAFFSKFTVLRAAVPKPPAGWQYSDDSRDVLASGYKYMPASECEVSSYYIGLNVGYERPMTQADTQKMEQAAQAQPDPAKQKKLEQLLAQQQALMQKSMAAAQKQDYKAVDALGKQGDALNAQISQVQQEMNAPGQAAMDAIQRDRSAKVSLAVNDAAGDVTCYGSPKPLTVPGAVAYACEAPATYSSPGEQLDPAKGRIVVVFGKGAVVQSYDWSRQDNQGHEHKDSYVDIKMPMDPTIAIGVQYVTVNIEGDDLARAQSLYKQMNLAPLAALATH